jgi:response regulator RpfG family c-di-GMP phosphodiesterase
MPMAAAAEIMAEGRGSHFEPRALDAFMSEIPAATFA